MSKLSEILNPSFWRPLVEITEMEEVRALQKVGEIPSGAGLQIFSNKLYFAFKNELSADKLPAGASRGWQLQVHRRDSSAAYDWRHLQAIKNQLVGAETLAIDVFPPESQLVDCRNIFHIWAFEGWSLPFVFTKRLVDQHPLGATTLIKQRPFERALRPAEIGLKS